MSTDRRPFWLRVAIAWFGSMVVMLLIATLGLMQSLVWGMSKLNTAMATIAAVGGLIACTLFCVTIVAAVIRYWRYGEMGI
jgi:hypothetical protein